MKDLVSRITSYMICHCWQAEDGMTTAEYAIGTIAAATFAGILIAVVKSGGIKNALAAIIKQALQVQ